MLVWTLVSFPASPPLAGVETRWVLANVADPRPLQFLGEAPASADPSLVARQCQTPLYLGFSSEEDCRKAMGLPPLSPAPQPSPAALPPLPAPSGGNEPSSAMAWEGPPSSSSGGGGGGMVALLLAVIALAALSKR